MKKFNWKKYIYKIVIVVLVIFFVGGVGLGAANILSIEGTYELYTPEEPATPYPETNEAVLSYIDSVIGKALAANPKTEMSESYSIDTDTLSNSADNAQITASAKLAAGKLEETMESQFKAETADFDTSASKFLSALKINPADVEKVDISYKYYKCSMCESHIGVEDFAEECPECGNINTLNERCGDEYEITVEVKPGSASFTGGLFPKTENIHSILSEAGKGCYTADIIGKEVTGCKVFARINRLTDEIKELRFETDAAITAPLTFEGTYADLGKVDVSAETKDSLNYSFTWAGVSLDKDEFTVELGSSEVLKATLTCNDPTKYTVKWTSDNEDVLTVDDEGYLKTHKKFGDANITASFTFNGKEYSDTCLVHVGVPAEGVDLSKGKLKLKPGEVAELKAKFDPKDSTNTVCYWFSNDESVAKINENGVVTAVGAGKTTVYVVTDYGNYYSSCEVEVTN